ncbi:hypothetical protein ACAW74_10020 [Fibrella sp. WM1]|uniref:hypothetical protein n=1 Tax=Fibrella musci TaxID=3242485 RepID=UPI003520B355
MKNSILPLSLALLALASCRPSTQDNANDAGGTANAKLAREVVGVRMLSNDANYDEPCNYLAEEFVRNTFKLGATTEVEKVDGPRGCTFSWENNQVTVSFGSVKPYPSIYHAEYVFNKLYQPGVKQPMAMTDEKPALSGPEPEGTAAEQPAESATGSIAKRDTSAANDTANTTSRVTAAAAKLTTPAASTGRFLAYPGLGDKAVWEPTARVMHVLLNNHILNVQVKSSAKPAQAQAQAAILANVIFNEVVGEHFTEVGR